MKFDVYCDESRPDLLSSQRPQARYMVIGSLWLQADDRQEFKEAIHELRNRHKIGREFKWRKISPSRIDFYLELVDWFLRMDQRLRFRCIAVEHEKVNLLKFHESDQELGFYKFYYQMLHHWIQDFNEYTIFCDFKQNRLRNRLHVLRRCLDSANLSSKIHDVQSVRSEESVLIQLADVLTGAAAACLNDQFKPGSAKEKMLKLLEEGLGREVCPTRRDEPKFNVFMINLQGGW
jgi:hypothetical protein